MPNMALCVGGPHDGKLLTMEDFRKIEDTHERMPIFVPHPGTNGFRLTVIKPRIMGSPDVVLSLLNGYRPVAIPDTEEDEDEFSDLFGNSSDDDWPNDADPFG